MIREDRFLISRRPYAVNLSSLRGSLKDTPQGRNPYYFDGRIDAVWFRRKNGVTAACIGTLWDLQHPEPADAVQFLQQHDDGRYGGDCDGRWDGESYWGNVTLEQQEQHYAVKVEYFGEGKWAVHDGFGCLGIDGTWDEGLHPYGRGDDWLAAHRFDQQTAIKLAREAAPGVTVHGITAAQVLARREQTKEAS